MVDATLFWVWFGLILLVGFALWVWCVADFVLVCLPSRFGFMFVLCLWGLVSILWFEFGFRVGFASMEFGWFGFCSLVGV